ARGADVSRGVQRLEAARAPNAPVLFQLAAAYSKAGRQDQAVTTYLRGLQLDSRNPEARYNAALALMNVGKFDVAAEALRETIRQRPLMADAYVALGTAEMRL